MVWWTPTPPSSRDVRHLSPLPLLVSGCRRSAARRERSTYGCLALWDAGAITRCGNGRETTCHCRGRGRERDSRAEARPRARPALPFTSAPSPSVCLSHLSPFPPHLLSPSLSLSFRNCISLLCLALSQASQLFQTLTHL